MDSENTFNSIGDVLNVIPENYMIMEETIDLEIQREYYELTKTISTPTEKESIDELINSLQIQDLEKLKQVIVKLAMLDAVEAYRALEKYNKSPNPDIKEWATLALQQSRMVMQSSLLEEQQVFISTGLGGKKNKLRYILIFPYNNSLLLENHQQKILDSELQFFLKQYEGEFEDMQFQEKYATSTILLPLEADIPSLVKMILSECNQLGNYLSEDVMITNMKRFNREEILAILDKHTNPKI